MIGDKIPAIPYAQAARNLLRETVLVAVDELVRRNGWAATSISTVAKAAGVSRQTVYNEFGSRQSIAEAYILGRLETLLDAVEAVLLDGELEPAVRKALDMFFDMVDEPLIQTVLSGWANREELVVLVRLVNEQTVAHLTKTITEIRPDVDPDDAVIFADTIARLVVAHAIAPTIPRSVATERMVRLAIIVLGE
jgi:AcrR family transcriptional regulator